MASKYIRTKDNQIIVFSEAMKHSEFKSFNPISAGFVAFYTGAKGDPDVVCSGQSFSLNLKPLPDDTDLARQQLLTLF